MKNFLLLAMIATLSFINGYGQEPPRVTIPDFNDKYCAYVQRLEEGDTTVDYQDFRFSFLDSKQFVVATGEMAATSELTKKMYAQMHDQNFDKVISTAKQMLSIDYTNMPAHKALSQAYAMLGDTVNAKKYYATGWGLLSSIVGKGDGRTPETAWPVIQVSEEYVILDMLGAKVQQQSLINKGGMFDRMDVSVHGEKRSYYFEVSKAFEGYDKLMKK